MRFHNTLAFGEARTEYDAARQEYATFDDNNKDAEARAEHRLTEADKAFFNAEAYTPSELLQKIAAAHERDLHIDDGGIPMASIQADLHRLQRHAVSPDFAKSWEVWRSLQEKVEAFGFDANSGIAGQTLREVFDSFYCEIALKSCTTPGDFILKCYLSMLNSMGSFETNRWDIDIGDGQDEARFDRADNLGRYYDIDASDIGANLLAYGLLDFDATVWMEAADKAGLKMSLVQQPDGNWLLGWSDWANDGHLPEHMRRQQRRLIHIMNFPYRGSAGRHHAIAEEIRRGWPDLIYPTRMHSWVTEDQSVEVEA